MFIKFHTIFFDQVNYSWRKSTYSKIFYSVLLLLVFECMGFVFGQNQVYSQYLKRAVLQNGGNPVSIISGNYSFTFMQSVGQEGCIGSFSTNGYILRQGFLQPFATGAHTKTGLEPLITIYPNPATDHFLVNAEPKINEPITINLFDLCGKLLYSSSFPTNTEIKVDFLPPQPGLYLLNIKSGNQQFTTKLIKE